MVNGLGIGIGARDIGTAGVTFTDNILLNLGTDGDIAMVLNSAGLSANTELTNVIVGTSVYATAIPANSLIISNITDDGDIVFFAATSGNSIEAMRIDASTRQLLFPLVNDAVTPTIGFGDGVDGIYQAAAFDISFVSNSVRRFAVLGGEFVGNTSGSATLRGSNAASATVPTLIPAGNNLTTGIGAATADQLSLIAGSHEMLRLVESTALANYVAALFDAADQVSLTSANASTWRLIQTQAINVDWDGGVLITALNGQTAYFDRITNTADQATVATVASTVYIVGGPIDGTNVTFTNPSRALHVAAGQTILGGSLACGVDAITSTGEGVAASLTSVITHITTNGDSDEDNVTLADGVDGQIKIFTVVVAGNAADSIKVTPASMIGGTQITFAADPTGLGCIMQYDAGADGWTVIGNNAGTVA